MIVAVCLELAIATTLVVHRSIVGVLLCLAYAWFSATWAFFKDSWNDD